MADSSAAGFGKDPLITSHGDALADQSFQSLKSKEIRDSLSPTEMRFQSMTLNNPNTTGWNVQSAKEISPDGRGFRAETVATTDGVESVNGGIAEFKGRNEERSSAHHEGDDKNFVKKAMESSDSHLQEKVVIGDENSGRTEVRTSSTKSSSSSQVIQSSTNVEYDNGFPIQQPLHPQKYLMDTNRVSQQDFQHCQQEEQQRLREEQRIYEQQFQQQRQQHLNQQEHRITEEQVSTTHQNTQQKNVSQNIQTQETHEQNKRYVDMDKASPEYQQHVQHLMQQPGEIISSTVEYPKPNIKMITTVKRLPDGTIVRNKRYETEELPSTTSTPRSTSTPSNQTQTRRDSHQSPSRNYQPNSSPHSRPSHDMVDSSSTSRYVQDTHTNDVETKFSSTKKSSSKFSTETTSETIQEFDEHHVPGGPASRPKPKTDGFSTHGFPSVRADKPTQEYPNERPHAAYPSHSTPTKPNAAVIPRYGDDIDNISERRINAKDGEVITVSSEKKRNYKSSTNSERIVETEHTIHDDHAPQPIPHKNSQDFSTHGFPSVREPSSQQPKNHPSERQMHPHEQDFPMDKLPPGTRIIQNQRMPHGEEEVVVVSSQKSHTAKHSTNIERIIEHDIIRDGQTDNLPRIQPGHNDTDSPYNYTVTTPGEQIPKSGYPSSPQKPSNAEYTNQEFPSLRTPGNVAPGERKPYYEQPTETIKRPSADYTTHGYPSVSTPSRPAAGLPSSYRQHQSSPKKMPSQDYSTQGFPSVRTPSKTTPAQNYPSRPAEQAHSSSNQKTPSRTPSPNKYKTTNTTVRETTERVIKKEKEVDSAHRAFAASLRSSSPFDHTDYHPRHTPRSSVSSNRTFKRDMREGSHESAPSEMSRISTTTVTRNTPPRAVGGRTVVSKTVATKTGPGSNDSLNAISPRVTKSPSPGKIHSVTITTTRTLTSKDVPKVTEKSPRKTSSSSSQPAPSSRSSTTSLNSRKPPASVMTDDYDDDNMNKPSPFSSPSSRSRTPQKALTTKANDKSNDDWLMAGQPDNDERRTVPREITFEQPEDNTKPQRRPNLEPNVEWVIVDDRDYDSDNDSFPPEVVDANLNVKKTITEALITQEKQVPSIITQKKHKPTASTTTITTKQSHNVPFKTQTRPNDKTIQKIRPQDTKPVQTQTRTNKPLTNSSKPGQSVSKTPTKLMNNKNATRGPTATPVTPAGSRKPLPKSVATEETALRKTTKTSQVLNVKTSQFIETEKLKESKIKPQTPDKRQLKDIAKEKPIVPAKSAGEREPERRVPQGNGELNEPKQSSHFQPLLTGDEPYGSTPQDVCYEPQVPRNASDFSQSQEDIFFTPQPDSPEFVNPQNALNKPRSYAPETQKPRQKSPALSKPSSPGFQKLQMTFDQRSPYVAPEDGPLQGYTKEQEPQRLIEEHVLIEQTSQNYYPHKANEYPNQQNPAFNRPQEHEPQGSEPKNRKPKDAFAPHDGLSSTTNLQNLQEEEVFISKIYHQKVPGKEIPENEPHRKEYERPQQPSEAKPGSFKPDVEPLDTDDEECQIDNQKSVIASQKKVAKHIQKFETNFWKNNKPETQKATKAPVKEHMQAPKKQPQVPAKLIKGIPTAEEPSDTEEDKQFENTAELIVNSKNQIVTNETVTIQKTQSRGSKSPQRVISPTRNQKKPEEFFGRRPQSPGKQVSPTRGHQPEQKEPVRKPAEESRAIDLKSTQRIVSPNRNQNKTDEPFGKRSQPTDYRTEDSQDTTTKVSQRVTSPSRTRKSPEKPFEKRPQSPNKNASPQRPHTSDDEICTTSWKATKLIREKLTQESDNESPAEYPKDQKYLPERPNEEMFIEISDDSTQKRVTKEIQINKFEKPWQPGRKSPEKLTKLPGRERSPEKRTDSVQRHISPTRSENKPILGDNKLKYPKYYPERTLDDEKEEETTIETRKRIVNVMQKENLTEQEYLQREENTPKKFKSPSPTFTRSNDLQKQPEDKLLAPVKTRSQSPNKYTTLTHAQKKPETNESLKSKNITKEFIIQEGKEFPKAEKDQMSTRPQSPKKSLSPTRKSQPETFQTSLMFTKAVTENPEKLVPGQQCSNQAKSIEQPSDEEPDETLIRMDSKSNEDEFVQTTFKTIKSVTEKRARVSAQDDEFLETYSTTQTTAKPEFKPKHFAPCSDKPSDKEDDKTVPHVDGYPGSKLPEEPITSRFPPIRTLQPEQTRPGSEEFVTTNKKTIKHIFEETTNGNTKPFEPSDTNEDKTYSKTIETTFKTTDKTPQNIYSELKIIDDQEIVVDTREIIANTSQKLIENEQTVLESERELCLTDNQELFRRSSSPKERKNVNTGSKTKKTKPTTENDTIFKKSLREDHKADNVKHLDTDEEEITSETEDLLIETCEKRYVVKNKYTSEEESTHKPDEFTETAKGPSHPKDAANLKPKNEQPFEAPLEPWLAKLASKNATNLNEQLIESERHRKETPDGAFISKSHEPSTPTSPTFRKKGAGRSDTFEERCRQILGMDNYGDTQGTFKKQSVTEIAKDTKESVDHETATLFQVKIEDCDEDDEPLSMNSVKKSTMHKKTNNKESMKVEPNVSNEMKKPNFKSPIDKTKLQEDYATDERKTQTKFSREENDSTDEEIPDKPNTETTQETFEANEHFKRGSFEQIITERTKVHSKESELANEPREKPTRLVSSVPIDISESQKDYDSEYEQTITETTSVQKACAREENKPMDKKKPTESLIQKDYKIGFEQFTAETKKVLQRPSNTKPLAEIEPDFSEPEINASKLVKETKSTAVKTTKKYSPVSTPRSSSPTKSTSSRSPSPTKSTTAKDTPTRKPSRDLFEPKPSKTKSPQQVDKCTTNIKDRLRSSNRKSKSPAKPDQVDGSDSSPERSSPTRYTERRRSSNISVTTEIIIEHTDSDTPVKKEKSPTIVRTPQDSVYKEIIDSTVLPEKLTRRLPVTERKESAPVHRVTSKDKDTKMSRSTSENLIKVKGTEPHTVAPKTSDHRRPNKCFATKSINLMATDRIVNCGEMENVIIDIQHAKSSREPSPDKIVPTPVPAHLDTGKPRYPDVVQEPEDDQPKRSSQIKNIPIFEEENNSYIGCHITEINMERSQKTTWDSMDYDDENILKNPLVEAPPSLDYITLDKPSDDESLLTVHEKVNKFQNITQKINKPKAENTENPYSPIKLGPPAPQRAPELVRTITKNISRQTNETDSSNEVSEDFPLTNQHNANEECLVDNTKKFTKEFQVSHHEKTTEKTLKTAEKYQQPEQYVDHHDNDDDNNDDDDDELIPHTATHTTVLEERRQKDILSRPSVFESRSNKNQPSATTATITMRTPVKCNKSPIKDSEKLRPDNNKSRTKPTSAATNITTEQTLTTTTTAKTSNATSTNKPKQLPERISSADDIDYEFRGNNIQTGVKNIISKQTKVYKNNNNTTSSDSKPNDLKKLTTTTGNKKIAKHSTPVRLTPSQNTDEHDLSADDNNDDDDDEMIVALEETTDIDIESQVVNEHLNKETASRKIPLHNKQPTVHSSTNSSPRDQSVKTEQKDHLVKLTDNKSLKSNTTVTTKKTASIKTYETIEKADEIDETVLEPRTKKSPSPSQTQTKTTKMSTTTTDSVAAKRSLFENNNGSPKRTPLASPMSGRRPSYMEHTKSSLEHTRKDSLEINKTNYSRKPSQPDEDEGIASERNSLVKFDVPHGKQRSTTPRTTSVVEDINVEEIFDLEALEKLLETVQSYEIRRRIRAQTRLIKKNQRNEAISNSLTEVTTSTVKTSKDEKEEETDTVTTTTRRTRPDEKLQPKTNSSKKEYIFEEAYLPTTRRSPKPNRYPYERDDKPTSNRSTEPPKCSRAVEHARHHSPDKQKHTELEEEELHSLTSEQHYYSSGEHKHEELHEITKEASPSRKSPSPIKKTHSSNSSPERRHASPEYHSSLKENTERSRSPQAKSNRETNRKTSSRSPDNKTSMSSVRKSSTSYEQQESVKSSTTKPQTKRNTSITKTKPEDKAPVWADRKNILKAASSASPKKPSSSALDSRAGYTKTVKSTTGHKTISNKSSSFVDDDCVTSSYGIGPTDENGLPLFGIRALKKKKPSVEPSETTEEVTGYVVEEKYYSNNKSKPTLERKEFIYSTNPEELQKLKEQVEFTSKRTSLKDIDLKESREAALIQPNAIPALRSSPEDDFLDSTTKYVRRGSVKEMSEKFIQKEATASLTEKTNTYPKAGLILRTSSRKSSRDMENESDNYETFKSTRVQQQHHTSSALADSDDNQYEYEVEEVESRQSGRCFIAESESECDSIKTQREFKKVTSSASSSMATRSFLNSQGEEKVITNVSDCLERMRNADNVVEEGDTAEDQEARALLNKFLGASIIMRGAESSLPATNRQSNIITTTTTTSSNLNDNDNDGDNNAKHEVKTTRITKTIKSGSSSAPVTYTTCDIEEIWDEEILKELLEQARTYEERRKIRSRLRELMADREEKKQQKSTSSRTEKTETKEEDGAVVTTTTKVTTRTVTGSAAKPVTPFAKFQQLDKQNSQQSAKSPTTPTTTGGGSTASPSSGNQPIFKFTDPALNAKAATVKEQLLQWCQAKTQEYENIEITNFSTSWNNGLAFCALIHHFLPDAFDYSQLTPKNRRKNFELAFTVADEKAGIAPLLDVEDMVVMQRPDWKCVFVYVQSIYRRFRNCQ